MTINLHYWNSNRLKKALDELAELAGTTDPPLDFDELVRDPGWYRLTPGPGGAVQFLVAPSDKLLRLIADLKGEYYDDGDGRQGDNAELTQADIIRRDFEEVWESALRIADRNTWSFDDAVSSAISARLRLYREAGLLRGDATPVSEALTGQPGE
jgi:hypothetical protein